MAEKKQLTVIEKRFKKLRVLEKILHLFLPFKKIGLPKEKYDDGAYLMVCNHYRVWDVLYPAAATTKPVRYMGKASLWNKNPMKWLVNYAGVIAVNRDGQDVKALMQAIRYLKAGEHVCIFPEGTRNTTEEPLLPFKGGATLISIMSKRPILPIMQIKKAKFFRKAEIVYGEPIEFTELYGKKPTEEELAECDKKLVETMLKLREDYLAEKQAKKQKKSK
ncbi:MAG: 1-acyl-sn-glycerol-3-phosphate acyltransferase [Clostridiales bacterium]|nr:1-acyl-sn-glycerol-3-phosphate acyltransferase [Clostridiales bacterium]